jgi:hypothetical protein
MPIHELKKKLKFAGEVDLLLKKDDLQTVLKTRPFILTRSVLFYLIFILFLSYLLFLSFILIFILLYSRTIL